MNWKRWGVVLLVLSLLWLWQQWPDGKLRVFFCDVGQGDATLVVWGTFQALVDTGPSERKLFECLGQAVPFWDREIDLVFISHPQKDHNGALPGLRERYRVKEVIERARISDVYRYKDLYFDVLFADESDGSVLGKSSSEENEDSMVITMKKGDFSVLFTADIGTKTESILRARNVLEKVTVLKVPHHGSKNSSTSPFLEVVSPLLAVISVGERNSYGHPHEDSLARLRQVGARIFRTDQQGNVVVVYDGYLQVFTDR